VESSKKPRQKIPSRQIKNETASVPKKRTQAKAAESAAPASPLKKAKSLSRAAEDAMKGEYEYIIGVDEAGRGPLAGPVVAAACHIEVGAQIDGIIDSKQQTSEEDREIIYEQLTSHPGVTWGVSIIDHKRIDEINILQATMEAMRISTENLLKSKGAKASKLKGSKCLALIDGNRVPSDMPTQDCRFVIKGDGHIFSIAAASIIAKVTRDRIMLALDKKYPQYGFAQHKGYPTFAHRSALVKHGPCPVHRMTYGKNSLFNFTVSFLASFLISFHYFHFRTG
jgi:ribonuclease HII